MPRPKDHTKNVTDAVQELLQAVTGLITRVQETLASGQAVGRAAVDVGHTASAKSAKLKSSLKSYWSKLKGKAREERIRKMLAGRGLTPKAKAGVGPKGGRKKGRRGAKKAP
jgi:hypothetical protein